LTVCVGIIWPKLLEIFTTTGWTRGENSGHTKYNINQKETRIVDEKKKRSWSQNRSLAEAVEKLFIQRNYICRPSSPPRAERLWGPPSLLSNRYQGLFRWGKSERGVKLTTDLHLVPRSKNAWSCTSTLPIRLHGVMLS
jgi:hypothetical protein